VVSGGSAPSSGLLFWHPMPTGIGYWFHRVLSRPTPLGIREFAHCWGRDFRDHGGSWDIRMVLGCWRLGFVSHMCFFRVHYFGSVWLLLVSRRDISPGLSLAREIRVN